MLVLLLLLEVIEEENLLGRSLYIGEQFQQRLSLLKAQYPELILDVRNQGAMIAMELVQKGDEALPNTELTQALIANAAQNGLILLPCGFYGNVIRFLPPLTITDKILAEGLDAFERMFKRLVD